MHRRARLCANTAIASQKARGRPASRRTSSTVDVLALRHLPSSDGGDGGDDVSPTDNDDGAPEQRVLTALGRANGLHLAERLVAILLRIDMPLRLAELARVPEENRDGFLLAVFDAVIDVWEHDSSRKMAVSLNQNEVLSRATDALRAARQALADLDEECKKVGPLGRGGLVESQFWWNLPKLTAAIEQEMDRFFEWTGEETELPRPRAHRRGRRPGTVENPRFRVFIRKLRHAAKDHGGRLGLQKNTPKGALWEAVTIVAPHLPRGFVPKPLSASTLQRIISGR